MAKKLKNLKITSVDLCKQGANQEAYITLKKSLEGGENMHRESYLVKVGKAVLKAIGFSPEEPKSMADELDLIKKSYEKSTNSIIKSDLSNDEKAEKLKKSVSECLDEIKDVIEKSEKQEVNKMKKFKNLTAEEKAVFDKYGIEYEVEDANTKKSADEGETTPPTEPAAPATEPTTPTAPADTESVEKADTAIKALKDEVDSLKKANKMAKYKEVAKKYEVIGKKPDELAKTLCSMEEAGEEIYKSYITELDEMVTLQEESGIFTEIGKSGGEDADALETAVAEIRKSSPETTREQAIVKACTLNPKLKDLL